MRRLKSLADAGGFGQMVLEEDANEVEGGV